MDTDGWTDKQRETFAQFKNLRAMIAKLHRRNPSPIVTELDDEGSVYVETDGYFWVIREDGTLDEIS